MAFQAPLGPIFGKFYSDEKLVNFQDFFSFCANQLQNPAAKTTLKASFLDSTCVQEKKFFTFLSVHLAIPRLPRLLRTFAL